MISQTEIPHAQVLRPSMADFTDFETYMQTLDNNGSFQEFGMVKVIPPPDWKSRSDSVENSLEQVVVSSPIEQNVQGRSGIYELLLLQKKGMKLHEYRKKIQYFDHLTDHKTVEEVEELFWKSISFSHPLYGADLSGRTLFDAGTPWNLNELPGILRDGLKYQIAGVTNAYLYIGSWKSMFGWHKEDMDLYSINYNHYGKPKFWYCLPASEEKKLEDYAKTHYKEGFSRCKEYLRHKLIMIHPYLLKQQIPDLKIYKMVQHPGEFIIISGGAYHAGFNWGFNVAEAVNFATVKWMEMLPNADACRCVGDSVKIDKIDFFNNILTNPKYDSIDEIKKICAEHGVVKCGNVVIKPEKDKEQETSDSQKKSHKKPNNIKSVEEAKKSAKIEYKEYKKGASTKGKSHKKKENLRGVLLEKSQNGSDSGLLEQSKKIRRCGVMELKENPKVKKGKSNWNKAGTMEEELKQFDLEKSSDFENAVGCENGLESKKSSFEEEIHGKESIQEGYLQDILDMQKSFLNEDSGRCLIRAIIPDNEFLCDTFDTERMEISQSTRNE